jgi:GT2 family glycosyltransferase
VSIVILTALGATHLPECLGSLRLQNYPGDLIEVIVVDNGSAEDPTGEVHAHYPGARVLRNETNIGFAAGNNVGAEAATGDYLVFLNDDTRAHPDFLRELTGTALRRSAAAVASCLLDWSGQEVDFVDSAVNFEGKGFQLHYGTPTERLLLEEKPLLFGCGAALLIDRAVFHDVGGWDENTFAYYEDVELGWRLNLLGHEVWFAPRAVVYHKHHGTSARWPEPPRIRLYERNSLRNLYVLLDSDALARTIPAALLLAADRALLSTGLSRVVEGSPQSARQRLIRSVKAAFRARRISKTTPIGQAIRRLGIRGLYGLPRDVVRLWFAKQSRSRRQVYLMEEGGVPVTFDSWREPIPIDAAAILAGLYGFLSDLPKLSGRRAELQGRRRASDQEVLGRFGTHWLSPSPAPFQPEHNANHAMLVDEFALASIPEGRTVEAPGRLP